MSGRSSEVGWVISGTGEAGSAAGWATDAVLFPGVEIVVCSTTGAVDAVSWSWAAVIDSIRLLKVLAILRKGLS